MRVGGRDRERGRDRIPSRLRAVRTEPNAGLDLRNHEIMTWASWMLNRQSHPGAPAIFHVLTANSEINIYESLFLFQNCIVNCFLFFIWRSLIAFILILYLNVLYTVTCFCTPPSLSLIKWQLAIPRFISFPLICVSFRKSFTTLKSRMYNSSFMFV